MDPKTAAGAPSPVDYGTTATEVPAPKPSAAPEYETPKDLRKAKNHTIPLQFPFEVGGVMTGALTMRRPTARDRMMFGNDMDDEKRELKLFSHLCNLAPNEFDQIDLLDYGRCQETFRAFLGLLSDRSKSYD